MHSQRLTGWRRIASALWHAPNDPQIYGMFEVDAAPLLDFIRIAREQGHRLTPTHLVGRAVAMALHAAPDLNVRLVGDRAVSRASIDVFFIAAVAEGHDLTGVKVMEADRKAAIELAKELDERAGGLRRGEDPHFARAKRVMDELPMPLLRLVLRVGAWLASDHALDVPGLGIQAAPFGSAMVSSVGMFGLPMGFSPLVWMYGVPLIVLIGELCEKPVAVNGRVEVRPVLPVTATIDHRYVDGAHLAAALKAFREYLATPASFEPPLLGAA